MQCDIVEIENLISDLNAFIIDNKPLLERCDNNRKPFSIILSASDRYYWENYHSDILATILGYSEIYLRLFIEFLNKHISVGHEINFDNYQNYEVSREKGRIDILIRSEESRHCIIIENKINYHKDEDKQISRYYKAMVDSSYTVDSIIYWTLDGHWPDGQSYDNNNQIRSLILNLGTYEYNGHKSFPCINDYLGMCKASSGKEEEISFIAQYQILLKYLRGLRMNYELMDKLFSDVFDEQRDYEIVRKLFNELLNITEYREARFEQALSKDKLGCFSHVYLFTKSKAERNDYSITVIQNDSFLVNGKYLNLAIDVIHHDFEPAKITIFFRKSEKEIEAENKHLMTILNEQNYGYQTICEDGYTKYEMKINFRFPEDENRLINFIYDLTDYLNSKSASKASKQ